MNEELKKTYSELHVILNNLSIENYSKIPEDIIKEIENNKDENYKFDYDYELDLAEQNISELTKEFLANIYSNYILDK